MELHKPIVYLDMDGVLASFAKACGGHPYPIDPPQMFEVGFFRNLEVMPGAKEAVSRLLTKYNVYIASKHTTKALSCATEKMQWIEEHFPELLFKINLVCDKGLLIGDHLIDDDLKWEPVFMGQFHKFDENKPEESWNRILKVLGC